MAQSKELFNEELIKLISKFKISKYTKLLDEFDKAVTALYKSGELKLKPEYKLGEPGLEFRVKTLLEEMGLTVEQGRAKLEDLIVKVPEFIDGSYPLVIEVKSGSDPGPKRLHLRQLDDWVFELSGEQSIRKSGIRNQVRPKNKTYRDKGAVQSPKVHPSIHKGVFIYNGSLGTKFEDRKENILGFNEQQFADARSFCVISFPCLLEWANYCKIDQEKVSGFWNKIQMCSGELEYPNK